MIKKIFTLAFLFSIILSGLSAFAYTETYTSTDSGEESWVESNNTYCSEKKGLFNKFKSAFAGRPTGYTPQVQPSPYINPYYGPSYQQGFYTGNRWNDHNAYYPSYPIRVYGGSF